MDFMQVGSRIETHTLSVRPEALTWYPSARSPTFGVLIGLEDANSICIADTFHAEFLCLYTTKLCMPFSYTVHTLIVHIASWRASSTLFTNGRQRFSLGFFPEPIVSFVQSMTVWCFSPLGCMLSHHRYTDTPCFRWLIKYAHALCKVSLVGTVKAIALSPSC